MPVETEEEQPKYLNSAKPQWVPNYSLNIEGLTQNKDIINIGLPAQGSVWSLLLWIVSILLKLTVRNWKEMMRM